MAFKDNKIKGIISNNTGNGIHSFGAFQYFQYTDPVLIDPATNAPLVVDVATAVGLFSSTDSGSNLTEIVLSPTNISISAPEATLSNVTVWSANSILTQGRGDSRYQNATNNTYANLPGTPNLSLYLTTANAASTYLPSTNFTYANIGGTIPTATNTTLGAVKVGSNLTIANGVLSATSAGGFQNGDTLNGGTY